MEHIIKLKNNKYTYEIPEKGVIQYICPFIEGEKEFKTEEDAKNCAQIHVKILEKESEISQQAAGRIKNEVDPLILEIKNMFNTLK